MPELPEVETVANGVNDRVGGQRIESAWFGSKPEPFKTAASLMAEQLPGRRIDRVRRVGKHIVFDLGTADANPPKPPKRSGSPKSALQLSTAEEAPSKSTSAAQPDAQWIVHLGMTGRLLVCAPETQLPAHTHAVLRLSAGSDLRFVDPRRFGRLALLLRPSETGTQTEPLADEQHGPSARKSARATRSTPDPGAIPVPRASGKVARKAAKESSGNQSRAASANLTESRSEKIFGFTGPGSEPLTITPAEFAALFRSRKLSIKSALLNQKLLHGVGNIYADESLFRAAIRPRRFAGRLNRAELLRLHAALIGVLRNAIALGGSSVSDYVDADGVKGFFQLEHRVYQRTGQPCLVCDSPIRRIVLGGRSTHYCPTCQR